MPWPRHPTLRDGRRLASCALRRLAHDPPEFRELIDLTTSNVRLLAPGSRLSVSRLSLEAFQVLPPLL